MIGPHLVPVDGPLCGPYINFKTESDRQRWDSTVGMISSFRLQGSGFQPPYSQPWNLKLQTISHCGILSLPFVLIL